MPPSRCVCQPTLLFLAAAFPTRRLEFASHRFGRHRCRLLAAIPSRIQDRPRRRIEFGTLSSFEMPVIPSACPDARGSGRHY